MSEGSSALGFDKESALVPGGDEMPAVDYRTRVEAVVGGVE